MIDSGDEDLLGMHGNFNPEKTDHHAAPAADNGPGANQKIETMAAENSNKQEKRRSLEEQQAVSGSEVPLGTPVGSGGGGGEASYKARRRRKQSPVTRFLRESVKNYGGGGDRKSSSSSQHPGGVGARRQSSRRRSGEKIYQGRMNRKSGQQQQQQQQQPDQQQQQQQQEQRPQHQQQTKQPQHSSQSRQLSQNPQRQRTSQHQPPAKKTAGWSDLRRRSRDGADQIRRRLSMTQNSMKRRTSMDGSQHQMDQLRRESRMRDRSRRESSQHGQDASTHRGDRQESKVDVRDRRESKADATPARDRRESKADADISSRKWDREESKVDTSTTARDRHESKADAEIGSRRWDRQESKVDTDKKSGRKLERRFSKSTGHALKNNDDTSTDDEKEGKQERKMSQSMFDPSDTGIGDSSDSDDNSPPPKPARTVQGLLGERDRLKRTASMDTTSAIAAPPSRRDAMNRRASFDSSLKDLNMFQKVMAGEEDEEENDSSDRRTGRAPRRKSLDSSINIEGGDPSPVAMSRRRSSSLGASSRSIGKNDKEEQDKEGNGPNRRRSLSWDLKDSQNDAIEGDDGKSQEEYLKKMFGKPIQNGDKRKTHTGMSSSDREGSNLKAGSRRHSEHTKALERRREIASKKKRHSVANPKSSSRTSHKTNETIPESADNSAASSKRSAQSASVREDVSYGSSSRRSRKKKKKWGVRLSPIIICTCCMCYFVSILAFLGLGFFLHMFFFGQGPEQVSSPKDNGDNGNGNFDQNGDADVETMSGGKNLEVAPSLAPSLFNNTGEAIAPAGDDGSSVTKSSSSSQPPMDSPTGSPIFSPTGPPIVSPTETPSLMPTTSYPSMSPTLLSSSSPSLSQQPSYAPSDMPSSSPTSLPGCPEQLLNSVPLGGDGLLTMKYEVVIYAGDVMDGVGGLFCVSLEYTGGSVGWIGLAFSEAKRDPAFGRKEAIIGMPGIRSSTPVSTEGGSGLGQQNVMVEGGPTFANPAKYAIPAGGMDGEGYYGPSLKLLSDVDKQTLVNGTVSTLDPDAYGGVISDQSTRMHTQMSFAKYLREPGEIQIDPSGSTLLLYAVATPSDKGNGEYDGNPDWKSEYLNLLGSSSNVKSARLARKRKRQHNT